jgi:hypothetical protein
MNIGLGAYFCCVILTVDTIVRLQHFHVPDRLRRSDFRCRRRRLFQYTGEMSFKMADRREINIFFKVVLEPPIFFFIIIIIIIIFSGRFEFRQFFSN